MKESEEKSEKKPEKAEKAGHETYIDHGLSRQIGHIGQFNYTHTNIPPVEVELAA